MHQRTTFLALAAVLTACGETPVRPPRGPNVAVEFRASTSANLEESVLYDEWKTVCASPCKAELRPDRLYRVNGDAVTSSKAFVLNSPSVVVSARTGSSALYGAGCALLGVGIPTMIVGSFFMLALFGGGGHGVDVLPVVYVGAGLFAAGTASVVGGSLLMRANDTVVDVAPRAHVARFTFRF